MRAYIILMWKEQNVEYPRLISREEFLNYLDNIIENSEITKKVKALSKEADSIYIESDTHQKTIIFKYNENIDFNEDIQRIEISKEERIYYFIKSYCQESVIFNVIENNQEKIRSKSKNQMISIMQAIKNAYPDNNEVSTKLCEILPYTYSILINKDRNDACPENPIIICNTVNEKTEVVITIKNVHKIIWAHLNEWCH